MIFIRWIFAISITVLVIDWCIMGLKIFSNDYDITVEAHIALVCIILLFICGMYKVFSNRCKHCGKIKWTNGEYCSYCGKQV